MVLKSISQLKIYIFQVLIGFFWRFSKQYKKIILIPGSVKNPLDPDPDSDFWPDPDPYSREKYVPFEDEVGGGAGELVERLAADGAGSVDPQVGGEAGLWRTKKSAIEWIMKNE